MPLNAYLLNHPNDLNLITKYNQDKNVIYARNYFTFFMCKNKKIKKTPHKKLFSEKEVDFILDCFPPDFRYKFPQYEQIIQTSVKMCKGDTNKAYKTL